MAVIRDQLLYEAKEALPREVKAQVRHCQVQVPPSLFVEKAVKDVALARLPSCFLVITDWMDSELGGSFSDLVIILPRSYAATIRLS